MPSLNLKTKTLRYHAADERCLESAMELLQLSSQYDKLIPPESVQGLLVLLNHIRKTRSGKPEPK